MFSLSKIHIHIRRPLALSCFVLSLLIGILTLALPDSSYSFDDLDGETITVTGTILAKEYRQSDSGQLLRITLGNLSSDDLSEEALKNTQHILCDFSLSDESFENTCLWEDRNLPMAGRVTITGSCKIFSPATNHGAFDAKRYYRTIDLSFRMKDCNICSIQRAGKYFPTISYHTRRFLSHILDLCLNEQDSSIMKAMLLGEKGFLDTDTKALFQAAGIVHILSISGLHIGILAIGLYHLLQKCHLSKTAAAIPSICMAIFYGFLTGLGISMLRAILMFLLNMIAQMVHRTYDLLTSVFLVGAAMLLFHPLYLQNTGFLFSFGAVSAIALFLPALDGKPMKTCGLPVATLPIYLTSQYTFPLYSVFLNLAVIPLMSVLLGAGLLVLLLGSLFLPMGRFAAFPVHFILLFYQKLCAFCLTLPGHTAIIGHRSPFRIICYFLLLSVPVLVKEAFPKIIKWLWILSSVLFLILPVSQTGLWIHFIDVGQGDGILLQYKGHNILVDGGSSSISDVGKYQIAPLLKYYGISRLDCCIISHEDSDHMNGTLQILEDSDFTVDTVYLPDVAPSCTGDGTAKILETAESAGVPVRHLSRGDTLTLSDLTLSCLSPETGKYYDEANNTSIVLLLRYRDFTTLLTGDLESGDAEDACLDYVNAHPDLFSQDDTLSILKCQHHGSSTGSSNRLLSTFRPICSVISCGKKNRYGHPHQETLDRLSAIHSQILDTRFLGEITIRTKGKNMTISGYCSGS